MRHQAHEMASAVNGTIALYKRGRYAVHMYPVLGLVSDVDAPIGEVLALWLHFADQPSDEARHHMAVLTLIAFNDKDVVGDAIAALESHPVIQGLPAMHLRHGLDHLADGQFVDAWPPLIIGLEGAKRAWAVETGLVTDDQRFVERPGKLASAVESLYDGLPMSHGLRALLRRWTFSDSGNPYRHGWPDKRDVPSQVLMMGLGAVLLIAESGKNGDLIDALRKKVTAASVSALADARAQG